MTAITCFQKNFVGSGVYSPFNRRLTRGRSGHRVNNAARLKRPDRAIRIGDHINPYTGEILPGQAYLPLSILEGTNRAIGVFGESGAGKCLPGESGVRLKDGTCTTIEKLYNSNFKTSEVLSCNLLTSNIEFKKIINITRRKISGDEKIIRINTVEKYHLTATGNHKIFIWDRGFVEKSMFEIKIGDFLISYENCKPLRKSSLVFCEVNDIEEIKYNNYVYDLEVKDNHNFFVGDTIQFLVHNSVAIRVLVEYFAIEEGRCVIIFDDTKNQYWAFKYKQDRPSMLNKLKSLNIEPTGIPEVVVYSPGFDEPVLGFNNMQRDFHTDKLLSLKSSAITAEAFFELGNIDATGRMYHNQLKRILNVPAEERTIDYINSQLMASMSDPTLKRSISSLINIFSPLCAMGIIKDDGTDVTEMLHPPRKGKPGRVSVINLSTSKANDCRKNAVVATICQQIFDKCREDRHLKPVIVLDEAKSYIGKKSSDATLDGFSLLHLQGRAWDITRIWGYQNQDDIAEWIFNNNTNYLIQMTKSLSLLDGGKDAEGRPIQPTVLNDSGLAHIFISGSGDVAIPDMDMYVKILPCRTKHVD